MCSDRTAQFGEIANGRLSLGQVALSMPVAVRIGRAGVEIETADIGGVVWPLDGLHASLPLTRATDDVLLTSSHHPGVTLYLSDPAAVAELARRAPRLGALRQRWSWAWPGLATAAVVGAIVGTLWVLDVSPTNVIAQQLPDSMRTRFGENVLKTIAGNRRTCTTPAGDTTLRELTAKLMASVPDAHQVRISVVDWRLVNAFTAPGGQIIVTRALIEKAQGPDELAGVLAHELGHAIARHPEAAIIRVVGLGAASEMILGGGTGSIGGVGVLLAQMSYTREAEREADAHAFRLLKAAGISPQGIGAFFRRIGADKGEAAAGASAGVGLEIFASHPSSAERARLADAQDAYSAKPALDEEQWQALRTICGVPPAPVRPIQTATAARVTPPAWTPQPQPTMPGTEWRRVSPPTGPPVGLPPPYNAGPQGPTVPQRMANAGPVAEASGALARNPNDEVALRQRARAYMGTGNFAAAVQDWSTVLKLKSGDPEALRARGLLLLRLSEHDGALRDLSALLRINPKDAVARAERGRTYQALKRFDEAIPDLRAAIELRGDALDHNNLGVALLSKREFVWAATEFTSAFNLDKANTNPLVNRGLAYEQSGRKAEAIADYRAVVAMPLPPADKYPLAANALTVARARLKALGEDAKSAPAR